MHKTIKSIDSFSPEPLFARLFSVVFGTVCVCVCVCVCVRDIINTKCYLLSMCLYLTDFNFLEDKLFRLCNVRVTPPTLAA